MFDLVEQPVEPPVKLHHSTGTAARTPFFRPTPKRAFLVPFSTTHTHKTRRIDAPKATESSLVVVFRDHDLGPGGLMPPLASVVAAHRAEVRGGVLFSEFLSKWAG